MQKIVIYTASLNYSLRKSIYALLSSYNGIRILLLHENRETPILDKVVRQVPNIKKHGYRWFIAAFKECAQMMGNKNSYARESCLRVPGCDYDEHNILGSNRVEYICCEDLHGSDVIQKTKDFSPDLGIAISAPILKEHLFRLPRLGSLNLHKGKVPHYRGMPPAFWELWNDEKEVGCTIHKIESGLDTGDVLLEASIKIRKYSTARGLQIELDELAIDLLVQAIEILRNNRAVWRKQPEGGHTYRKPTLRQISIMNKRCQPTKRDARYYAKQIFYWFYINVFSNLRKIFSNDKKIVVLLYHRVNDELRDDVTVGIEQFDRQMSILNRYGYSVLRIDQIINDTNVWDKYKRIAAVTFDDGYYDNFKYAVPILLRNKINAAFFISTGIIGTERSFPHDLAKNRPYLQNLSWENVKRMHEYGFTIGSHTESHLNCATSNPELTRKEIRNSKRTLETILNLKDVIFAYPHGKRTDITPEMLQLVRDEGYLGCLSAYGGVNRPPIDRYNIVRVGIDWKYSDLGFRARLAGFCR